MNAASACYSAIAGGGGEAIADFLVWLVRHRGLGRQVRVLDVGCGPGLELRSLVPGGEVVLKREHEIDFHVATFATLEDYRLIRDGTEQRVRMRHVYAMTSLPELEYQLQSAGFRDLETYGSYAARSAEAIRGDRMLISGVRPV